MAERLCLAASPTFAAMAVFEAAFGGQMDMICGQGMGMNGMALMYGLMSVFHLAPWLKRFSRI